MWRRKHKRVILKEKEPGKRSQLWRMMGTGILCHDSSSPSKGKPSQPRPLSSSLVLDVSGLAAVTDNSYEPLMLRRPDSRRSTTQTWHSSSGMLTCGLPRVVVQVRGGVSGLYDGAEVVLGPDSGVLGLLPEQQFINQKMRPGSGAPSVQVLPDGPTQVLQISDFNQRRMNRPSPSMEEDQNKESAQKKVPEEELELDNQLLGTTQPVMLCVTPSSIESSGVDSGPALQVNSVKVPSSLMLTDLYKHLTVTARPYTVVIEEKLLMKLLIFFGYGQAEGEVEKQDENLYEQTNEDAGTQKRYYFENLKISLPQVKLSVFISHKLPP